jgi:hypothetical protein
MFGTRLGCKMPVRAAVAGGERWAVCELDCMCRGVHASRAPGALGQAKSACQVSAGAGLDWVVTVWL